MSTVASMTTQMLRGWGVVGGGVVLTVSAAVRRSTWEDALNDGLVVVLHVESISTLADVWGGTADRGGALLGARCISEVDYAGVAWYG